MKYKIKSYLICGKNIHAMRDGIKNLKTSIIAIDYYTTRTENVTGEDVFSQILKELNVLYEFFEQNYLEYDKEIFESLTADIVCVFN